MSEFGDDLAKLCARELAAAKDNDERLGLAIERVACSLGLMIAIASRGEPAAIDRLLIVADACTHREAARKAMLGRMIAEGDKGR